MMYTVTVEFTVDAEDAADAEQRVDGAVSNLLGGEITAAEVTDTQENRV